MSYLSSKILKARITSVTLAFFILLSFLHFSNSSFDITAQQEPKVSYNLTAKEKKLLKEGDIILRKGYGFVSSAISEILDFRYNLSHCGILILEDKQWKVVHTVSSELSSEDGVQSESLNKFVHESVPNTIIVVRYKEIDQIEKLVEYSKQLLLQKIPFDHAFDLKDGSKYYCTELIYRVFIDALGSDIFEERHHTDHPDFLAFDTFFNSEKFDIVLNHQP